MAFVLGEEIPHRAAGAAHGFDHLPRFGFGHARVVEALHDEERPADGGGLGQRADLVQEVADLRHALVAVFGAAQVAAVVLRVFEKGEEIRDADAVDAAAEALAEVDERGERHIAAVAATGHGHARGVERGIGGDAVEERADVLDGILALESVVEGEEGFAEAGRAADVGHDEGDAQLVEEKIVPPLEDGPRLSLGAAVDADEHGPRAGEFRRIGTIHEAGHFQTVEAPQRPGFGLGKGGRIEAAALAFRPPRERAGGGIERPRVGRRPRRGEAEPEGVTIRVPRQPAHHAGGQRGSGRHGGVGRRGHEAQHAAARFVRQHGEHVAIRRQVEGFNVPRDVSGERGEFPVRQCEPSQPLEFAVFIAGVKQRGAVMGKHGGAARDRRAVGGGEPLPRAGGGVHQPEVAGIGGEVFPQHEPLAVGRPIRGRPAAAFHLDKKFRAVRPVEFHHPNVVVAAVAARGGKGEPPAVMRPRRRGVARGAVRQPFDAAIGDLVAVELEKLAPARVLSEKDGIPRAWAIAGGADRFSQEGQLPPRATRHFHGVQLRRGAKAGGDQHFPTRGMPPLKGRGAELKIARRLLPPFRRHFRHAFGNQIRGQLRAAIPRRHHQARQQQDTHACFHADLSHRLPGRANVGGAGV